MKSKFLKIGLALFAIMAVSIGNAQQTSGDNSLDGGTTTTGAYEKLGQSSVLNGTVRVIDNKGTKKYLQVKNGLTLLTDATPDGGIVSTFQLGGTLTDDTYIDATGAIFALDGIELINPSTDSASTNAVNGEVAKGGAAAGTGYTLLVRDEETGETKTRAQLIEENRQRKIKERAKELCEYCLANSQFSWHPFPIDHVQPESKEGKSTFDNLPDEQGVYYFLNKQSIPIYIGKSKHIKKRIAAHFGIGSETRSKNRFIDDIYDIKVELLEDDLITDLLECHEIKTHWPKHNKEYKKRKLTFGIYHYKDALGLHRFHISKVAQSSKPLLYFSDFTSAYEYVKELTLQFSLCPKHSGLQKKGDSCLISEDDSCQENCRQSFDIENYKSRLNKAYEQIRMSKETFILLGKASESGNRYFVLAEEGQYLGFGQTNEEISLDKFQELKKHIELRKSSYDIEQIILLYLRKLDSERILV